MGLPLPSIQIKADLLGADLNQLSQLLRKRDALQLAQVVDLIQPRTREPNGKPLAEALTCGHKLGHGVFANRPVCQL